MAIKTFLLPDLGEGLPEAEIVNWLVAEGDSVSVDQPIASVETAKAVVEVPSPYTGRIAKLHGAAGDIIPTHSAFVDFDVDGADTNDTGAEPPTTPIAEDSGTVVGSMPTPETDLEETVIVRKKGKRNSPKPQAPSPKRDGGDAGSGGGEIVTFFLPDLGEGLPEAEIVSWHVAEGDSVKVDQPIASVETAKAVVEVPSPHTGRIAKLHGAAGDVITTHAAFVDFNLDGATAGSGSAASKPAADSGTVVGNVPNGGDELTATTVIRREGKDPARSKSGRVKAAPSARALCRELGIDIDTVAASGRFGQITKQDVQQHAAGTPGARAAQPSTTPPSTAPRPVTTGAWEKLRGPRRAMMQSMTMARSQVMECTLFDDADIHGWLPGNDISARIIRALVAGVHAEPGMNAWFDGDKGERLIHPNVDLAMAVDTPDGLIVPVLRDVGNKDLAALRVDLNWMKDATRSRSVAPSDMKDPTITLSNFGMMAGRYATPVVVPPQVAILGTGGIRHDVVPVLGGIETHRRIPLSLTFDHRCLTGGEACRFLAAVIKDLQRAN
jgi:2-oxoisovalerate dehydrogenase E2 component (dihydrolipoyl transacylase)